MELNSKEKLMNPNDLLVDRKLDNYEARLFLRLLEELLFTRKARLADDPAHIDQPDVIGQYDARDAHIYLLPDRTFDAIERAFGKTRVYYTSRNRLFRQLKGLDAVGQTGHPATTFSRRFGEVIYRVLHLKPFKKPDQIDLW